MSYDTMCPICGAEQVRTCRCFLSDSKCARGHEWHFAKNECYGVGKKPWQLRTIHTGPANHGRGPCCANPVVVKARQLFPDTHRTRSLEEAEAARAELQRHFESMARKGWTTLYISTGIDLAADGTYAVRVNVAKIGAGASQIPKSVNGIEVVVRETGVVRAQPVQPLVNCVERGELIRRVVDAMEPDDDDDDVEYE